MTPLDGIAVALYFAVIVGVGLWQRRRTAATLEAHFLGERRISWPLLALSGAISNFDLTGTMWIVSVLYTLGVQAWWQQWMWGVALPAFGLAYMAKWVRRSAAITGAEWMITRFGDDAAGRAARYAYASVAVLFTAGSVAYALQGMIKFSDYFFKEEIAPATWSYLESIVGVSPSIFVSLAVLGVTTAYVIAGGLYSVVATDVVQAIVLTASALIIAGIAYAHATPQLMAEHVPSDFADLTPMWRLTGWRLAERPDLAPFGWFVIAWVGKGFLTNAGGPAQMYDFQRYLAARSSRDACKLAAAWPFFLAPRWAMTMGIVLLALTNQTPTNDPEQIMPAILRDFLPAGVRGFVLAGLVAAFMTTLAATVNSGAAYLATDLYIPLVRSAASRTPMLAVSGAATLAIVVLGAVAGVYSSSIDVIWNWLQMSFVSGLVIPNCLRWYWWRLNGWGYAAGVLTGSISSLLWLLAPSPGDYYAFLGIAACTAIASVVASLLTAATPRAVLVSFYETVRPFGFWRPIARESRKSHLGLCTAELGVALTLFNLFVGICGVTALYLLPMYLVGRWHVEAMTCGVVFVVVICVLRYSWWPMLPADTPLTASEHRV
ncbi:sodium:solute symporter family transporter [Lacipirellula sp.]|uniref:sodium:solute symporter family transporter n=1 Tax=Lacipirellula sp. TaxID=2691419 RepID=UPI003D0DCDFE